MNKKIVNVYNAIFVYLINFCHCYSVWGKALENKWMDNAFCDLRALKNSAQNLK